MGAAAVTTGAIVGGTSLVGSGISALASTSAAKTESSASLEAAQLQYDMYNQTAARLQPWTNTGTAATNQLGGLLGLSGYSASGAGGLGTGALTTEFQPTTASLSQTPGYQFTLGQGLAATSNQAAAIGQGSGVSPTGATTSGPEGQGIAGYAENLASTTYQQQFQNYWTQLSNIYNMLSGTSSTGASAAAGTGQAGTSAAQSAGSALQSAGASTAAGTTSSANALTGSLSNIGNYALIKSLTPTTSNPVTTPGSSSGFGGNTGTVSGILGTGATTTGA